MFRKELGATGVFIPEIGIGTSEFHARPGDLREALESGAWFIDTAESYGTEHIIREAIDGLRDQVFLATKVSPQSFRRTDLLKSVDNSLQRLGVEFVDLLQLHYPNDSIPIDETVAAMEETVDAGKVKFIGVSNFSLAQLRSAQKAARKYPIVSNQVRYNLVDRTIEQDLLPYCREQKITVIAYSPLAKGLNRIQDCDPDNVLRTLAAATGKSPAQVALNWCLCKEGVVAIPKSNSLDHLLANTGASNWRLTLAQVELLNTQVQFRNRTRLDAFLRRYTPEFAIRLGMKAVNLLPKRLRRRVL